MSEKRKYRQFTPEQKAERARGPAGGTAAFATSAASTRSPRRWYYQWRDRLLEGGSCPGHPAGQAAGGRGTPQAAQEGRAAGAGAGPQDLRVGDSGGTLAGLAVSVRVARARAVVATGTRPVGRRPRRGRVPAGPVPRPSSAPCRRRPRPAVRRRRDRGGREEQPDRRHADGRRAGVPELGEPVNRKRLQRVMRGHRLLQRSRNGDRRRRPGYFRVFRPDDCGTST